MQGLSEGRPPSKFRVVASNWEPDSVGPRAQTKHEHLNAKVNSSFGVLLGRGKKHTIEVTREFCSIPQVFMECSAGAW